MPAYQNSQFQPPVYSKYLHKRLKRTKKGRSNCHDSYCLLTAQAVVITD